MRWLGLLVLVLLGPLRSALGARIDFARAAASPTPKVCPYLQCITIDRSSTYPLAKTTVMMYVTICQYSTYVCNYATGSGANTGGPSTYCNPTLKCAPTTWCNSAYTCPTGYALVSGTTNSCTDGTTTCQYSFTTGQLILGAGTCPQQAQCTGASRRGIRDVQPVKRAENPLAVPDEYLEYEDPHLPW